MCAMKRGYGKIAASYFVILVVFIFFGLFLYRIGYDEFYKYFKNNEKQRFESEVTKFSKPIKNLYILAGQINALETTKKIYPYSKKQIDENILLIMDYSDYFSSLILLHPTINNIGVYFFNSNTYVGNHVTTIVEKLYDDFFKINDFSFLQWKAYLRSDKSHGNMIVGRKEGEKVEDVLFYSVHLPVLTVGKNKTATLIIELSKNRLINIFNKNIASDGAVGVFQNGELVIHCGDERHKETLRHYYTHQKTPNKDYLFLEEAISIDGWKVVKMIPLDIVQKQLDYIPRTIFKITFVLTTIFMFIFSLLYHSTSMPYKKLLKKLDSDDLKMKNISIEGLLKDIETFYSDRKELEKIKENRDMLLKSSLAQKLLSPRITRFSDFQNHLSECKVSWKNTNYQVAILKKESKDELEETKITELFKHTMSTLLDSEIIQYERNYITTVFILCYSEKESASMKENYEFVFEVLKKKVKGNFNFHLTVGNFKNNYSNIWESYEEAEFAFDYSQNKTTSTLIYFDEISKEDIVLDLPVNKEKEISLYINRNQMEKVYTTIESIFPDAEEEKKWPEVYKSQFKLYVTSLLFKILSLLNVSNKDVVYEPTDIWYFQNIGDLTELKYRILEIIKNNYDLTNKIKTDKNVQIMKKIKEIIDDSYSDYNLSVAMISNNLGLTPGYLTGLFKESYGISIGSYIEEVRLTVSNSLLSNNRMSISEIANECGYKNMNTFYKAFKRFFGVSPTEKRAEYNIIDF